MAIKSTVIAAVIFSLFLAQPTWSATRYVEGSYGDDSGPNNCRNKNSPCLTITQAVDMAGNNDKIIVGPGLYVPDGNFELFPGVKMSSTAGAAGTIIDATNVDASAGMFYIEGDNKAAVGGKGKGFTILMDSGLGAAIYIENSNSVKIEGNRIMSMTETLENGINVHSGSNLTIRYNTIYSGGAGTIVNGINSSMHESNKKWIVTNNKVVNADTCMNIESAAVNNGNKTADNLLKGCVVNGLRVLNVDEFGEPSLSSKDKHTGNVVRMMRLPGSSFTRAFLIDGGNPVLSKNLADVTFGRSDGFILANTTRAIFKQNVALGPTGVNDAYGVDEISATTKITISGNTISGFGFGIKDFTVDEIKEMSKNNVLDISTCPFSFGSNVAVPKPLKASKNFWGDPAGPDLSGCDSEVSDAVTDGNLKFKPASKANPVNFKDKFH